VLSPYTWLKTDRGSQLSYLYHIGKTHSPGCPCGHQPENGRPTTFACSRFHRERSRIVGATKTLEELDAQGWVKEGDHDPYDQVAVFFGYLFTQLTGGVGALPRV